MNGSKFSLNVLSCCAVLNLDKHPQFQKILLNSIFSKSFASLHAETGRSDIEIDLQNYGSFF